MRRFLPKWKLSSTTLNLILSLYFTAVLNLAFFREVFSLSNGELFAYTTPLVVFVACNIVFNIIAVTVFNKIIIHLLLILIAEISYTLSLRESRI